MQYVLASTCDAAVCRTVFGCGLIKPAMGMDTPHLIPELNWRGHVCFVPSCRELGHGEQVLVLSSLRFFYARPFLRFLSKTMGNVGGLGIVSLATRSPSKVADKCTKKPYTGKSSRLKPYCALFLCLRRSQREREARGAPQTLFLH